MSGTNAFCEFKYRDFGTYDFEDIPKGRFFSLSLNPYNGWVVLSYNRSHCAMDIADSVLKQIRDDQHEISVFLDRLATFRDYVDFCNGELDLALFSECPVCGCKPDLREVSEDGSFFVVCCDGLLCYGPFDNVKSASDFWNARI